MDLYSAETDQKTKDIQKQVDDIKELMMERNGRILEGLDGEPMSEETKKQLGIEDLYLPRTNVNLVERHLKRRRICTLL